MPTIEQKSVFPFTNDEFDDLKNNGTPFTEVPNLFRRLVATVDYWKTECAEKDAELESKVDELENAKQGKKYWRENATQWMEANKKWEKQYTTLGEHLKEKGFTPLGELLQESEVSNPPLPETPNKQMEIWEKFNGEKNAK